MTPPKNFIKAANTWFSHTECTLVLSSLINTDLIATVIGTEPHTFCDRLVHEVVMPNGVQYLVLAEDLSEVWR